MQNEHLTVIQKDETDQIYAEHKPKLVAKPTKIDEEDSLSAMASNDLYLALSYYNDSSIQLLRPQTG